ncbi:MAG: nitrate reductase associated protein [Synechococcales bacterium]|nr:nitrate reductase associated protein [Synechococcales bacterium]
MTFFAFEADFVQSLRCIPMQVRYKLDTCGIKLKLDHWLRFSPTERQALVDLPCETPAEVEAYRHHLQGLVTHYTSSPAQGLSIDPAPPWHNPSEIPPQIQEKAQAVDVPLSLEDWAALTPMQRFALIKLSRPSHENHNFLPALKEFRLVSTPD